MSFIKNLSFIAIAEIVAKAVALFSTVYLARIIEPSGFGLLNFAMVAASYFAIPVNLGFNDYGVLKVAPNRTVKNIQEVVGETVFFRLILGILSFLILVAATFFIPRFYDIRILMLISGALLFSQAANIDWLYTAIEKFNLFSLCRIFSNLFYLGILVLLVNTPDDLNEAAFSFTAGQFLLAFSLMAVFFYRFGWFRFSVSLEKLKKMAVFILPLAAVSIGAKFYYSVDIFILGFMVDSEQLGYYTAALKLITLGISFKLLLGQLIYPKIVHYVNHSLALFKTRAMLIQKYCFIMGFGIGVLLIYLAGDIIHIIYGQKYSGAIWPLKITTWVFVLEIVGMVYPYTIIAIDQKLYAAIILGSTVLNIVLNILLIPMMGVNGAAVAYVLASLMLFAISYIVMRKKLTGIDLKGAILTPLLATMGMVLSIEILKGVSLYLSVIIGAIVFILVLMYRGVTLKKLAIELGLRNLEIRNTEP